MAKILVIAEHSGAALNPSTAKCVACAAQIDGAEVDIAVLGASTANVAAEAAQISSIGRVVTIDREENDPAIGAILAPQIAALVSGYSHVFGPSTAFGKDLMPRVAALLGVNPISDIMSVEGSHRFKRPIYAGAIRRRLKVPMLRLIYRHIRDSSKCRPASLTGPTCSLPPRWFLAAAR
jgi:electron transfer flavoprotein alpha subunit